MSCKYNLIILFFCGLIIITVAKQECGEKQLEGTSCTIYLKIEKGKTLSQVKWVHETSGLVAERKNEKNKPKKENLTLEKDGSLTFTNIKLNDTGRYVFTAFEVQGTQIANGHKVINVYAKVPKPNLSQTCKPTGNVTLTCDVKNRKDVSITWFHGEIKQTTSTSILVLPLVISKGIKYSCLAKNPVHEERSEIIEVSCETQLKLFGFDFWIMVSILAGGGALLLLLIIVLMICACRSCRKAEKQQQDEEELRLSNLQAPPSNGCPRSNKTARGQPAPPIPQYDPVDSDPTPQTPPQAYSRTKAQTRARPPPPPQDDDDDEPPPLPRPRNKQRRTRNQEPYRPME